MIVRNIDSPGWIPPILLILIRLEAAHHLIEVPIAGKLGLLLLFLLLLLSF